MKFKPPQTTTEKADGAHPARRALAYLQSVRKSADEGGNQMQSVRKSDASDALRGPPRSSEVLRGPQRSSEVLRGPPRSSAGAHRGSSLSFIMPASAYTSRYEREANILSGLSMASFFLRGTMMVEKMARSFLSRWIRFASRVWKAVVRT